MAAGLGTVPSIASSRAWRAADGGAADEAERVGMLRIGEQRGCGGKFDDLARVHDGDGVRHAGDKAEIVADEQERHAGFRLELPEQAENLRLHGDVERGRGFVRDQQRRVRR